MKESAAASVAAFLLDGQAHCCTEDVWVTYNGKKVQPGDTMSHIGIGNHDTLRCGGRLRGCLTPDGSGVLAADPHRIDEEFRKTWLPYFCRSE